MRMTNEISDKYSNLCLKSKEETIRHINENGGELLLKDSTGFSTDEIKELSDILNFESAETVYCKLGRFLSNQDGTFDGIYFREDCLEYLTSIGVMLGDAIEIMEIIRKGGWKKYDCKTDLPKEFVKWARGVRYLASRQSVFANFDINSRTVKNISEIS